MTAGGSVRYADLGLRAVSGLALAGVALIDVWVGGAWAAALIALALVLMLWELRRMVTGDGTALAPLLLAQAAAAVVAVWLTWTIGFPSGLASIVVGAGLGLLLARTRSEGRWMAAGLVYMGIAVCAILVMRLREPDGVVVILWLILVVVAADVGAYFVGRRVGGPLLCQRISPGKTWSGALGGLASAAVIGVGFAAIAGWNLPKLAGLSFGAAIASQIGDLLESGVKRHFGVKDASGLIPGHGGVMDRLDGVMGAAWFFGACDIFGLGIVEG